MAELRKPQENETLTNAFGEYLNPENSNPSTFRRFLSNLADNIAELTMIDKTAPEYEEMGEEAGKNIGSYATRYATPETRDKIGLEPAGDEKEEQAKMLAAAMLLLGGKGKYAVEDIVMKKPKGQYGMFHSVEDAVEPKPKSIRDFAIEDKVMKRPNGQMGYYHSVEDK